jgi:hypothetical protein
LKYHIGGRAQEVALGTYPRVSLKLARGRRAHARQQLAQGLNPRLEKMKFRSALSIVFSGVADEWVQMMSAPQGELGLNRSGGSSDPEDEHGAGDTQDEPNGKAALSCATVKKHRWLLNQYLNPALGQLPMASITAQDLLPVLKKIELEGKRETAHRARWSFSMTSNAPPSTTPGSCSPC